MLVAPSGKTYSTGRGGMTTSHFIHEFRGKCIASVAVVHSLPTLAGPRRSSGLERPLDRVAQQGASRPVQGQAALLAAVAIARAQAPRSFGGSFERPRRRSRVESIVDVHDLDVATRPDDDARRQMPQGDRRRRG